MSCAVSNGSHILIEKSQEPRFVFQAVNRRNGARVASAIEIGLPILVEGFSDDFVSSVRITGFVTKDLRAMGAFSFQAFDLAIQMAKAILASYDDEWEFYFSDAGAVTLRY